MSTQSKTTAALKTYVIWAWLERNIGQGKSCYPLFQQLNYKSMESACPWCEISGSKCRGCPLARVHQGCDGYDDHGKEDAKSDYGFESWWRMWFYNYDLDNNPERQQSTSVAAGNIAALAWYEYKRLGG